mmetsp:Transcript_46646/g.83485  ORF Transcript_46646/g.83485 Transcript_46646/m.83485 type:complete len:127 (+) Transcript_46646:1413-1793(+)
MQLLNASLDGSDIQLVIFTSNSIARDSLNCLRAWNDTRITQVWRQSVNHGLGTNDGTADVTGKSLDFHDAGTDSPSDSIFSQPQTTSLSHDDLAIVQTNPTSNAGTDIENFLESFPHVNAEHIQLL